MNTKKMKRKRGKKLDRRKKGRRGGGRKSWKVGVEV